MTNETDKYDTPAKAIVADIAYSIQQRAHAQGWTKKKADSFAVESAIGALMAAIAITGEGTQTTNALSFFAFMVSTRGMDYVHERALQHVPRPAQISQET